MSAFDLANAIADSLRASGFAARVALVIAGEYAVVVDHVRVVFVTTSGVVWNARLSESGWKEAA